MKMKFMIGISNIILKNAIIKCNKTGKCERICEKEHFRTFTLSLSLMFCHNYSYTRQTAHTFTSSNKSRSSRVKN